MFSVILLGLTGYRLHYTLSLSHPDVLTTSTHYYGACSPFRSSKTVFDILVLDPRIAALLVGSALLLILSLVMYAHVFFSRSSFAISHSLRVGMIAASSGGVLFENFAVLIVWIYLLITAALVTV